MTLYVTHGRAKRVGDQLRIREKRRRDRGNQAQIEASPA